MSKLSLILLNYLIRKGRTFSRITAVSTIAIAAAISLPKPSFAQTQPMREINGAVSPFCETLRSQFDASGNAITLTALAAKLYQSNDLNQLCNMGGGILELLPLNYFLGADTALAQQLIEKGANVNAQDSWGNSPLHSVGASVENTRSLLEKGANVNVRNRWEEVPLHNTLGQKTAAVMALIIEQGADINARSERQMTPLHFAYTSPESAQIADLLILNGAEVNAQMNEGLTPLHYAVENFPLAQRLLQAGADITLQNAAEGAPIHASGLTLEVLQLLIDQGADVNLRNAEGQTPLHRHRLNVPLVRLLLENGRK